MNAVPGARRSTGNLLIVLALVAVLAALGLLLGFYEELPDLARGLFGSGAARLVTALQARGSNLAAIVTGSETGAVVFLGTLGLLTVALLTVPSTGRQLLSVATTTFTEVRRGGALWLALAGTAAVAAGAPFLDYQGGAPERLKVILSAGLAAAAILGMLLAVALPALSFGRETETRSIYAIATKPLPRWAILGGKLFGVGLAMAAALAMMGAGISVAARLAMADEARHAEDPEVVRLNLDFRQDVFPEQPPGEGGTGSGPSSPRKEAPPRLIRAGGSSSCLLAVPERERGRKWLVLRLHAMPADPLMSTAPARIDCGEWSCRTAALRDRPVDVPVPASLVRDGRLAVRIAPLPNAQGDVLPLAISPRGAVSLAVARNGLEATLAKALALLWCQLMVVAAVTLAAAGSVSLPVAAVTGAAMAAFGQLSGLAVNMLRQSVEAGAGTGSPGMASQLLRKLAAGELALLPDFGGASAAEFLARGNAVPWSLLAAGALTLVILRALPAALVGAVAFSRREVGR